MEFYQYKGKKIEIVNPTQARQRGYRLICGAYSANEEWMFHRALNDLMSGQIVIVQIRKSYEIWRHYAELILD